jgi:methylthioribose-1-phosphate isomerase
MKLQGKLTRTIWIESNEPGTVYTFDQRFFPFQIVTEPLRSVEDAALAIEEMHVRGAPLIGATAAYGLYLATLVAPVGAEGAAFLAAAAARLRKTRPTAIDLFHCIQQMMEALKEADTRESRIATALMTATTIADESVEQCRMIGVHGLPIIEAISERKKGATVNVLTHCNAGWLACIDHGTATAPIYTAFDKGIDIHVWVDETRPRNQGGKITAFELLEHGVPHTIITDNAGGHLMQHGMVDMVIVGTDRTTRQGDVANKIGTYLKALAAHDNQVPFYVALPSSSLDLTVRDGLKEIPIEQRGEEEVKYVWGWKDGEIHKVLTTPGNSPAGNYGFDVTPARLVTGLITERGICEASETGILGLFPETLHVRGRLHQVSGSMDGSTRFSG